MKVTIEVDCTPLEARQFLGFPDVQPMQKAMMDNMQDKMISNMDKFTPEALLQSWFTFDPNFAKRLQDMFTNFAGMGAPPRSSGRKTES